LKGFWTGYLESQSRASCRVFSGGEFDVSITASEWEPDQEAMKRIRERVFARTKEIPAVFA